MALSFVTPAVPAVTGVGAGSDCAALGPIRTGVVSGGFTGDLILEVSNDNSGYESIASFGASTENVRFTFASSARYIRVRRAKVNGGSTPVVTIGAVQTSGAISGVLAMPAADGAGAATDVSAGGDFLTLVCSGTVGGIVDVEGSQDGGTTFADVASFTDDTPKVVAIPAAFNRLRCFRRLTRSPVSTPVVAYASVNAATGGGGSGAASQLDADGTTLDVNAIADGEYLRRVGVTVVGATVSSGGAYVTAYEVDFSALASQAIVNGANVIDGKTWTAENVGNSTVFNVINGTGLRIRPSGGDLANATRTAPLLTTPLTNIADALAFSQTSDLRVSLILDSPDDAAFENMRMYLETSPFGGAASYLNWGAMRGTGGGGRSHISTRQLDAVSSYNEVFTNVNDDVMVIRFLSLDYVEIWSGVSVAGSWPADKDLRLRNVIYNPTTFAVGLNVPTRVVDPKLLNIMLAAAADAGSGFNYQPVFKKLRFQHR